MAKVTDSTIGIVPSKETPKEAKTASAKSLHLPATPSGTITNSPENFFEYGKQLTSDQWSRTRGYLYRLLPAIRRKPSYIDRFSQPIDEEYILRHILGGSGRYQIMLNDRDGAGTFCKCILDLNDPEYPPRYNIHELDLTSDDNRQLIEELKQEGKLNQNGDVVEQKIPESGPAAEANALRDIALAAMQGKQQGGLESQAFSKMMEMFQNASNQAIQIALAQIKDVKPAGADPMIALLVTLFTKQMDLAAKQTEVKPTANDPLITLLMAQLTQSQKDSAAERQRNHELQLKMLEAKAEAADPMDMVEKVLNIQEKLGGGGEPRNWKEKLVDQGFNALPDILTAVKGLTYRREVQAQQQQQQRPQPQPPPIQPTAQAQPQTQQTPPQPGAQPMPDQPADPDIAFLLPIFEAQGGRFVQAFTQDPNLGGHHVAKDVIFYGGAATYERIARMGREKILQTIALIPPMQADLLKVGTQEMLNDFVDQFIEGPDPDDDEDDTDDEPIAAGKNAKVVAHG